MDRDCLQMTAPLRGEQKLPFFTHFFTGGTYGGCSNKISFILIFQIKIDISWGGCSNKFYKNFPFSKQKTKNDICH